MNDKAKSRTQITPKLRAQVGSLKKIDRRYIAKSEILQFRLDEETYEGLYDIAHRERKPVGTLVREWITGMVKEEAAGYNANNQSQAQNPALHGRSVARLREGSERKEKDNLKAINELMAFRRTMPKIPLKELLEGRHQGHKY